MILKLTSVADVRGMPGKGAQASPVGMLARIRESLADRLATIRSFAVDVWVPLLDELAGRGGEVAFVWNPDALMKRMKVRRQTSTYL